MDAYLTLDEAKEYAGNKTGDKYLQFLELKEEEIELLLAQASLYIDDIDNWLGSKRDSNQLLQFPRNWQKTGDIPREVKNATIELAVNLNQEGFIDSIDKSTVTEEKIGEIEIHYSANALSSAKIKEAMYGNIYLNMLEKYRDAKIRIKTVDEPY